MDKYFIKVPGGFSYWMDINVLNNAAEFISHEIICLVTTDSSVNKFYYPLFMTYSKDVYNMEEYIHERDNFIIKVKQDMCKNNDYDIYIFTGLGFKKSVSNNSAKNIDNKVTAYKFGINI